MRYVLPLLTLTAACGPAATLCNQSTGGDGGYFDVDISGENVQAVAAWAADEIAEADDTPHELICAQSQALGEDNYLLGLEIDGALYRASVYGDEGQRSLESAEQVD